MSDERKIPKGYRRVPAGTTGPKLEGTLFWSPSRWGWESPIMDGSEYYANTDYIVPVSVVLPGEPPKSPRKPVKLQETSLKAHKSQAAKAPVDAMVIWNKCRKYPRGTTCDRLEQVLGMSHQTVSARLNDLARKGKVVDSGRREKTRTGRMAICWKAVV